VIVSQRQGRAPDPSTSIALEDVEQLRENLARGDERVFSINAYIQVRAPDRRTLMERSDRIISTVRSLDFRALPTHWQHHMGLLSCCQMEIICWYVAACLVRVLRRPSFRLRVVTLVWRMG